jgi:hypothetical protein
MAVVWDIAPCITEEIDRSFRGPYWLHYQDHHDDGGSKHLSKFDQLLSGYTTQLAGTVFIRP